MDAACSMRSMPITAAKALSYGPVAFKESAYEN
jgi:hypothetical protein